jgi:chromosome segregation ATPase
MSEFRESLETLSLELNNQTLDLSQRVEQLDTNSSNWSFAVNEQIEEFRTKYVDVLEELRQSRAIAVEKEEIMTRKYQELVEQLKKKEELANETEALSQRRIESIQEDFEHKSEEVNKLRTKISEMESVIETRDKTIEDLMQKKEKALELEHRVKQLSEEVDMLKYELDRSQTKVQAMSDDTKETLSKNKIIKSFLAETESGRVLSHLLAIDQANIDELSSMTGIATYTVQQIVQRFRDVGLVTFDEGTRRVQLSEKF